MHYALLIYETQELFDARSTPEQNVHLEPWKAYYQALLESGLYVGGNPLAAPDTTATTVRVRGGQRHVQDGPFADTKEQLGGFMIIDAPTLDVALEWAARCPAAEYGSVEVRPLADLGVLFHLSPGSLPRPPEDPSSQH